MKHTAVVTYRLTGHKELTVQRFDLHNDMQRDEMDKLIDSIRAHAVLDDLGRVQYVRPGTADYHQVGFEVAV